MGEGRGEKGREEKRETQRESDRFIVQYSLIFVVSALARSNNSKGKIQCGPDSRSEVKTSSRNVDELFPKFALSTTLRSDLKSRLRCAYHP